MVVQGFPVEGGYTRYAFHHQSSGLGDLDSWKESSMHGKEEEGEAWRAEVLRQQNTADRDKRAAEQQRQNRRRKLSV